MVETPRGYVLAIPQARTAPDSTTFDEAQADLRQRVEANRQSLHLAQWLDDLRASAKLQSFVELTPTQP